MTQSLNGSIETISHQVDRLTIRIDDTFDGFRNRYERAVPEFQSDRFDSLVERGVDWQTILDATAENAPHDFILYWSHDFTSLMRLAGDGGRCVEYLMGNHTIAQKMYRYNPAILLYAPLRTGHCGRRRGCHLVHRGPTQHPVRQLQHTPNHQGRNRIGSQACRAAGAP